MSNTINRIYSLRQAADLTGFSQGKFRYNKDLLIENGATVSADGWRIPHTTLVGVGWIGVKEQKAAVAAPSRLELAEARVLELEAEVARLTEELNHRPSLFRRRRS
jgi:hypothetical protein